MGQCHVCGWTTLEKDLKKNLNFYFCFKKKWIGIKIHLPPIFEQLREITHTDNVYILPWLGFDKTTSVYRKGPSIFFSFISLIFILINLERRDQEFFYFFFREKTNSCHTSARNQERRLTLINICHHTDVNQHHYCNYFRIPIFSNSRLL